MDTRSQRSLYYKRRDVTLFTVSYTIIRSRSITKVAYFVNLTQFQRQIERTLVGSYWKQRRLQQSATRKHCTGESYSRWNEIKRVGYLLLYIESAKKYKALGHKQILKFAKEGRFNNTISAPVPWQIWGRKPHSHFSNKIYIGLVPGRSKWKFQKNLRKKWGDTWGSRGNTYPFFIRTLWQRWKKKKSCFMHYPNDNIVLINSQGKITAVFIQLDENNILSPK